MKIVGWIGGCPWHKKRLRRLGVKGKMKYNWGVQAFEHCEITPEIIQNLWVSHPQFWPRSFTILDDDSNQLPPEQQIYWKEEKE